MNSTNRGLNRLFVLIVGVILGALGAASAALMLVPQVRTGWESSAPLVRDTVDTAFAQSLIPGTDTSWIGVGVIAVLMTTIAVLVAFALKQGHGRTNRLIRDARTENGATVIESSIAEDLLEDLLGGRPELIAASVSTYDVRGTPTLNVSVTARRGVSPRDVARTVENGVLALDAVLGRSIPTFVQIGGGFRARANSATRLE